MLFTVLGTLVFIDYRSSSNPWPDLERKLSFYEAPADFHLFKIEKHGAPCWPWGKGSFCDEPRVTKIYRTSVYPRKSCDLLHESFNDWVGPTYTLRNEPPNDTDFCPSVDAGKALHNISYATGFAFRPVENPSTESSKLIGDEQSVEIMINVFY